MIDAGLFGGSLLKIEEAQEMMRKIYLERDRARGVEGTLRRTFDELEELRDAIENKEVTTTVADEVADVFAWLCVLGLLGFIAVAIRDRVKNRQIV